MVSLGGLLFLVALLLPTHAAFEEKDIQCQDPFDPGNTITVQSSLICDEFQNCFQALDERKDLCGNMYGVQLRGNRAPNLSVHLRWEVLHPHRSMWGSSAEEQRAAMFGPRQRPDGYFLTWRSGTDSFTVKVEGSRGNEHSIDDLRPWTNYTFFLRPYINSERNARGYKIGTASTVTVRTGFSDPQEVTVVLLDGGMAVVSWKAHGYVERFEVEVLKRVLQCYGCMGRQYATMKEITVEGSDGKELLSYNAIITAPSPEAVFRIKSCIYGDCNAHHELGMGTPKSPEPLPSITRLVSQSDSSFVLEWEVLKDDQGAYSHIDVHYCQRSSQSCHETTVESTARSLTVGNLRANTTYAVKLHLRLTKPGKSTTLGKPSTDIVTTWPLNHVGLEPAEKPVLSEPDAALYAWKFYGGSLGYMLFSLDGEEWQNCTEPFNCTVTVLRPDRRLSSPITGTLKLWNLQPYTTYTFFVRGCNDKGCGDGLSVRHTTEARASSPPRNLVVTSLGNSTSTVRWDPPLHPAGPLDGYKVSRECPGKSTTYTEVTGTEAVVEDLPEEDSCSLSVLAYHYIGEGYTLLGEPSYWGLQTGTSIANRTQEVEARLQIGTLTESRTHGTTVLVEAGPEEEYEYY